MNDFYQNGGSQAIIVRVTGSAAANATLSGNGLTLVASSPGTWGNALVASVDNLNITDAVAARYGLTAADLFNLTVSEVVGTRTISQERFLNLSFKADGPGVSAAARAQRVDRVLSQSSQLVRLALQKDGITPNLPTSSPLGKPAAAKGAAAAGAPEDGGAAAPAAAAAPAGAPAPVALKNNNDGVDSGPLKPADLIGLPDKKTGIYALETADLFNLLCIPTDTPGGDTDNSVYQAALAYCVTRRAVLIVDSPSAWSANPVTAAANALAGVGALGLTGDAARNATLYFPRVIESDPLSNGQLITVPPCGIVAGIMAQTDVSRGVWKAPAGVEATLSGINALQVNLTNAENGSLNPLAINCLRTFSGVGTVVWGARTLVAQNNALQQWKYVPVRRMTLFIEQTLLANLRWVVFEPNDEPLWIAITASISAFLLSLFKQGALQGSTPSQAFQVTCDSTTTTPQDQINGVVNIVVAFAPLKPAEFVVINIAQLAGQTAGS